MVYITGDLHGDISRLEKMNLKKYDTLIVCGDFGFIWDDSELEKKYIKKISKLPYMILFVDGTHENFDLLKKYPEKDFAKSQARQITDNIYQLLRGHIYEIDGHTFFTFGGGESVDKEIRQAYNNYWPEELPTVNEMKNAVANLDKVNRKVDYIITHEPSARVKGLFCDKIDNINTLNRFFDDVSKQVKYKKWFFGSVHKDRQVPPNYMAMFTSVLSIDEN